MNRLNSPARALRAELVVVLALETALVVALHWAASPTYAIPLGSLGDWFQNSDPTVSLVAVARIVALGIGYWLLVTTVLYAVANHLGLQPMLSVLRWVTLPVVRRIVQGVTAVSLTSASLMGPAALTVTPALAQESVVTDADQPGAETSDGGDTDGADGTTLTTEYQPDAAGWPAPGVEGSSDFWLPTAVFQTQAAGSHVVEAGDHLWSIAENHLRATVGRDVTEDEICQYWVRVIEANRSTIRSGDPDMILPDEIITLPSVFSE